MGLPEAYIELNQILSLQYDTVNGYDFYRFIFPDNENQGERHRDFSHPNAIYLYRDERDTGTKRRLRRRVMLNDTWRYSSLLFFDIRESGNIGRSLRKFDSDKIIKNMENQNQRFLLLPKNDTSFYKDVYTKSNVVFTNSQQSFFN